MMSLREYNYEAHVLESGSSTRALYISLPTVIANGMGQNTFSVFAGALVLPKKV